jgi:hypothetical protein
MPDAVRAMMSKHAAFGSQSHDVLAFFVVFVFAYDWR